MMVGKMSKLIQASRRGKQFKEQWTSGKFYVGSDIWTVHEMMVRF